MGQQWDQGRNQKYVETHVMVHNNPKSVGPWESSPKREIHGITGLSQKNKNKTTPPQTRKSSNKLTSHLKELEKEKQSLKWVE